VLQQVFRLFFNKVPNGQVFSIFTNAIELTENENVFNVKYAKKRAVDYIRSYSDSEFEVEPP